MSRIQVYLPRVACCPVRRIQDVPGPVMALPGPEKVLKTLFLKWRPVGRQATAEGASPETVRRWLGGMVKRSPNEEATRMFVDQSEPFGWRLLGLMRRFNVRTQILPREEYRRKRPRGSAGYYLPTYKTVLLDEEAMAQPNYSVVRHEMGHALEQLASSLCLRGYALSTNLWHGFAPNRQAFVTPYAATRPTEYFAESVEAYFQPHSRVWLEENDPGMHAFLKALFEISNL